MIITILGGIGSGKTLSVVKEIKDKNQFPLVNFRLDNIKYHRLKFLDILLQDEKNKYCGVNWDFWDIIRKKHRNYSIYLDEIHNIVSSRQSMSRRNVLMSKWLSQIRKILSDSKTNHLYIISQTSRKIDVDFRELAQWFVLCKKYNINGKIWIKQYYYKGYDNFMIGHSHFRKVFLGNPYFKYYDTKEMVRFSDGEDYL